MLQVTKVTSLYGQRGLTSTGLQASLIMKDQDAKISLVWKDFATHSN
jgi:hypothetical protein